MSNASGHVVEVRNLTRRFRRTVALDDVSLDVPRGGVFGLVGENGAGKTTLIRHLLGLLQAQSGSVRVFGFDPVTHPEEVLGQIGYLSEDRDMPGWMRVEELMRYTQAFYPAWDMAYAEKLRAVFELDPRAKLKTLSRGQLAKAGLLAALAHRPDLLLLDEPSSGLDPIVRRDILAAIVRTVAEEGRTVVFSSHLLDEVERVADRVAMVFDGHIVLNTTMEDVKEMHHRVVLRGQGRETHAPDLPGVLSTRRDGAEWTLVCHAALDAVKAAASQNGWELVELSSPSLEDIFVARAGRRPDLAEE